MGGGEAMLDCLCSRPAGMYENTCADSHNGVAAAILRQDELAQADRRRVADNGGLCPDLCPVRSLGLAGVLLLPEQSLGVADTSGPSVGFHPVCSAGLVPVNEP